MRGMNLLSLLLYLILIKSSSQGKEWFQEQKIVGGRPTRIWKCPFMASLETKKNPFFVGAAIILSPLWLAGAPHTLYQKRNKLFHKKDLQIRCGSSYRLRGGEVHDIEAIVIHYQFNYITFANNIMLLKVYKYIRFTKNKASAEFVDAAYIPEAGQEAVIYGWGITSRGGRLADQLHVATIRVVSDFICNDGYRKYSGDKQFILHKSHFCGTAVSATTCYGDGGGPILYEGRLIGIAIGSWKPDRWACETSLIPSVYTKIVPFYLWIENITEIYIY